VLPTVAESVSDTHACQVCRVAPGVVRPVPLRTIACDDCWSVVAPATHLPEEATSWHPEPEPGAYSTLPAWTGPQPWLDALGVELAGENGRAVLALVKITPATVLLVATHDAQRADLGTGRNLATAHATVATACRVSVSTVRRARTVLAHLGYAATVAGGRYLTRHERDRANAHHGGRQLRCASLRALTMPRRHAPSPPTPVDNEHLPRRGEVSPSSHPGGTYQGARGRAPGAAPRPHRGPRPPRRRPEPHPLPVQRLAGHLANRLPWLARGHIGALCTLLASLDLDENGWTAAQLLDHIDADALTRGLYVPDPHRQRNPLGLLRTQLIRAVAGVEPPRRRRPAPATPPAGAAEPAASPQVIAAARAAVAAAIQTAKDAQRTWSPRPRKNDLPERPQSHKLDSPGTDIPTGP